MHRRSFAGLASVLFIGISGCSSSEDEINVESSISITERICSPSESQVEISSEDSNEIRFDGVYPNVSPGQNLSTQVYGPDSDDGIILRIRTQSKKEQQSSNCEGAVNYSGLISTDSASITKVTIIYMLKDEDQEIVKTVTL